ncbi:hypothetical protein MMU07_05855 [Aquiflexum sp. LQ15W]|uniref:hypothetical protein n=1 Tax=Cognataquiflexum nitidum TaxID=2922272 RepID=UPI001F1446F0|nr:hypothetical protein [Cognataquiflexum nitidum]MCH6199090.1 hypothetical protein [Cognataquiflexum nitidum]
MTDKDRKYHLFALGTGILFLLTYFLQDYLWKRVWIFSVIPLLFLGIAFFAFFVLSIPDRNRKGIIIGIFVLGIISTSELVSSEIFKSKKILEATLMDDLSAIHLTLRKDSKFEMASSDMFNEDVYKGNYHIVDNKIIFEDERYSNDFIPDTLTIIGDKIIVRFDKNGNPIKDFATYFDIKKNEIKNAP